jgi:heat shock protein HslJ
MNMKGVSVAMMSLLLGACASSAVPQQGQWQQNGPDGQPLQTLQLKDGQLSASAGCNRMFGSARIEQGRLVVGPLASTLMACAPEAMQREQALSALLRSRPQVRLDGDRLLIGEVAQQQVWQPVSAPAHAAKPVPAAVTPVAPAAEQATQRFIYVAPERRACTGVVPMQCLQVRESQQQPWQHHYAEIEGFQFEPGTAYRLRIREIKVANPPADAPDRRWVLETIVEQIRIAP